MVPSLLTSALALLPALSLTSALPSFADGLFAPSLKLRDRNVPQTVPRFDTRDVGHKFNATALTAPHFVVYSDKWLNGGEPPLPQQLNGWTTFALCFWTTDAQDMVQAWTELTAAERTAIKANYSEVGVNLIAAAFGSTSTPTSSGEDPVDTANQLAAFIQQYDLDGVDIDYEDFDAMNGGTAVDWLVKFQTQLRNQLPSPDYLITHAPVAPWFTTNSTQYPQGNYLQVDQQVGSTIDWYNIQFYNQGTDEYTDCSTLLTQSIAPWSNASLFEIIASGVPADKALIGKPAGPSDASNGYMDPTALAGCVSTAKGESWDGGLMVWEWPDGNSSTWVSEVWGSTPSGGSSSVPAPSSSSSSSISSSSAPSPTSSSSSSPAPTSSSVSPSTSPSSSASAPSSSGSGGSGGSCAAAWVSTTAYTQGETVSYNGDNWTALYWTENDTPGGSADVWQNAGACTSNGLAAKARHARSFGRPTHLPRRISS